MMKINSDDNIQIKLVLMNGNEPQFVEYHSHVDSRTHIINAETFCDVFGVDMSELRTFSKVRYEKEK